VTTLSPVSPEIETGVKVLSLDFCELFANFEGLPYRRLFSLTDSNFPFMLTLFRFNYCFCITTSVNIESSVFSSSLIILIPRTSSVCSSFIGEILLTVGASSLLSIEYSLTILISSSSLANVCLLPVDGSNKSTIVLLQLLSKLRFEEDRAGRPEQRPKLSVYSG